MPLIKCRTANKLNSIKKYSISTDLSKKYILSNSVNTDGLDLNLTIINGNNETYVYYVGGIKYTTYIVDGIENYTECEYFSDGFNEITTENYYYIKDDNKVGIIELPKIESEISVTRQVASIFELNYRLSDIVSLADMIKYGGGYYNIINNT